MKRGVRMRMSLFILLFCDRKGSATCLFCTGSGARFWRLCSGDGESSAPSFREAKQEDMGLIQQMVFEEK